MSPSVVLVPGAPVLVPELSGSAAAETESGVAAICEMLRRAGRGAMQVALRLATRSPCPSFENGALMILSDTPLLAIEATS